MIWGGGWKVHVKTLILLRGWGDGRVMPKLSGRGWHWKGYVQTVIFASFTYCIVDDFGYIRFLHFSNLTQFQVSIFLLPNTDGLQDWKIMSEVAHDN